MAEIHHLQYGWVTPSVSYVLSVLGSLLGLICAVRLRNAPTTGGRVWWMALAALAIGGTGIWTMHFVAMLGFSVVGSPVRYDVSLTAVSAILAIVTVGIGLSIALLGDGGARRVRIVIGGVLAGLGVAAMHYTGMAAMRLNGHIDYGTGRVATSVAISVVAATVALYLAVTVRKTTAILGSALIMGVAVNGMHFTGMSAMSVRARPPIGQLAGATATSLLIPIGVAVLFGVLGLAYALMAAPTDEDRAGVAYLAARQAEKPGTPAAPASSIGFTPAQRTAPMAAPARSFGFTPAQRPPRSGAPASSSGFIPAQRATPQPAPEEAAPQPAPPEPGAPSIPSQPIPRRMPTAGSSWTFRDRTEKK